VRIDLRLLSDNGPCCVSNKVQTQLADRKMEHS
jgi:hypothetical protein